MPDLRSLVRAMVEATGATVLEAATGVEACERVREGGIDLVLLDMHMPVMDGAQTVATLRREGFGLPVVALSADVIPVDVARLLALDAALAEAG
ncbi:MAG: response regulator [Xanthomonadaceae bacterium]|nr:response regulator [Xanthomonadaceae bacterium]